MICMYSAVTGGEYLVFTWKYLDILSQNEEF